MYRSHNFPWPPSCLDNYHSNNALHSFLVHSQSPMTRSWPYPHGHLVLYEPIYKNTYQHVSCLLMLPIKDIQWMWCLYRYLLGSIIARRCYKYITIKWHVHSLFGFSDESACLASIANHSHIQKKQNQVTENQGHSCCWKTRVTLYNTNHISISECSIICSTQWSSEGIFIA